MRPPSSRSAELEANLAAVRARVDAACASAGRPPDEVTLVVVTKYFPRSDVDALVELGVRDIGESKAQEASAKLDPPIASGVRVHFIGQLQTNKAAEVSRWADVVHSVDRRKLTLALGRRQDPAHPLTGLIQVDLDGEDSGRGGVRPEGVMELADSFGEAGLRLGGVMAVAPRDGDPAAAFARLADISAALRQEHPGATAISAGMSGDLEQAVAHGATHLRVGSAILGSRESHR